MSCKEFVEKSMCLRYVYMVILTEICDGLDIKDRREGGVKITRFLVGAVG